MDPNQPDWLWATLSKTVAARRPRPGSSAANSLRDHLARCRRKYLGEMQPTAGSLTRAAKYEARVNPVCEVPANPVFRAIDHQAYARRQFCVISRR